MKIVSVVTGSSYGTVGTKTRFKDVAGNELYVGDLVDFELDFDGETMTFREPIVEWYGQQFIMGVQLRCNGRLGTFDDCILSVKKVQDHSEVTLGVLEDNYLEVVEDMEVTE